jgi:hypothetical protein
MKENSMKVNFRMQLIIQDYDLLMESGFMVKDLLEKRLVKSLLGNLRKESLRKVGKKVKFIKERLEILRGMDLGNGSRNAEKYMKENL